MGYQMMTRIVLLTIVGLLTVPLEAAGDTKQVDIRVSPRVAFQPVSLNVQVWIERDAQNRWLRITLDSADFFSSSTTQLDGESSPRLRIITFRDVPAGEYEVRVEVFGDRGRLRNSGRALATVMQ
jgi:hypothetical protein